MIPPFPASALRLHPFAPSVALTLALHAACLSGVRAQESGAVSTSPAVEVIGVMPLPGIEARMFIGIFSRRSMKPACISVLIDRA